MASPIAIAPSRPAPRFRGDEVVRETLRMLRAHAPALLVMIAALYWLPVTALDYAGAYAFEAAGYPRWYLIARTAVGLVLIEFLLVAAAAIALPPAGPRVNALARGMTVIARRAAPIAVLGLVMNATGSLGALLVTDARFAHGDALWLVPAALTGLVINLAMQCALGVASPVLAVEAGGLGHILVRAARLLAGRRLALAGFWAAVTASRGLFTQLATVLIVSPFPPASPVRLSNVLLFVVGAGLVLWGVVCAAFYRELVHVKDGGPHRAVAAVFD